MFKLRKSIVSALLATVVFSSISGSVVANNAPNESKVFGTISQIAEAQMQSEKNEEPRMFGVNFESNELNIFQEKTKVKIDVPSVKKITEDNPSEFAGLYYEPDTGNLVVLITKDSDAIKRQILGSVANKDKVVFKMVKYSKADIEQAKKTIRETAPAGSVKALIPDVKNNKLYVSLSDNNVGKEEAKAILSSVNTGLIEIIPDIKIDLKADEATYGNPFPMGSRITGRYDSNNNAFICSAGFKAINAQRQDVVVTAGHCDTVGATGPWWQGWRSDVNPSIGNWAFRTTSSLSNGDDRTSDAGYITLNGTKTGTPWVPHPSRTSMTPITGIYINDLAGDTVYMRGATTGALSTGQIRYANVDVWYGVEQYGYVRDLVFADYTPNQGGDSGAPVLANYAWDNDLQSFTFKLAGINSATITVNPGHPVIAGGDYSLYSPVWAVFNDLNLSGLYLVN